MSKKKKSKGRKSKATIKRIVKRKTTMRAKPRKRPHKVEPPQPAADAPPLPSGPMNQAASIAPDPIDVNR